MYYVRVLLRKFERVQFLSFSFLASFLRGRVRARDGGMREYVDDHPDPDWPTIVKVTVSESASALMYRHVL